MSTIGEAVLDFDSCLQQASPFFQVPESRIVNLHTGATVRLNEGFYGPFNGDTLSTLFDAIGPRDRHGIALRYCWEKEQRDGKITNEELLRRQVEAVLTHHTYGGALFSVEDAVALASLMLIPMTGADLLLQILSRTGVETIIASNGCDQFQSGLMQVYFPTTPNFKMFANILVGTQQRALSPPIGVDKGAVVRENCRNPLIFAGDSTSDASGAQATVEMGGHVICLPGTLANWCLHNLKRDQWTAVTNYIGALPKVQQILRDATRPRTAA
jgi:hypothetical protein